MPMRWATACFFFALLFVSCDGRATIKSRRRPINIFAGGRAGDDIIRPKRRGPRYKAALWNTKFLWNEIQDEDGRFIVPYTISVEYEPKDIEMITTVMEDFAENTCVTFRDMEELSSEVTEIDSVSHIFIWNPKNGECASLVGRQGGRQEVRLSDEEEESCLFEGTVAHELLHALGLEHEHNRSDRDDYITIFQENVETDLLFNFDKVDRRYTNYGTRYNYESVMHYQKDAFTKNGEITMKTKDPKYQDIIGSAKKAAPGDFHQVCRFYNCTTCLDSFPPEVREHYGWQ